VVVVPVPVERDGEPGDGGGQEAGGGGGFAELHAGEGVLGEHDAAELERGDGGESSDEGPAEPFDGGEGLAGEGDQRDHEIEGGQSATVGHGRHCTRGSIGFVGSVV
jgi:hypothetical protein